MTGKPDSNNARFFNGRRILSVNLYSKLTRLGLEQLLWEIQKWAEPQDNLDNPEPKNIHRLLRHAGFKPDNYRSSYAWASTLITVKTTLSESVVKAINEVVTTELEKSPCPDAVLMSP